MDSVHKDKFHHVWIFSWEASKIMLSKICCSFHNISINFVFLLFLSIFLMSTVRYSDAADITDITRLRTDLLTGYDKYSRPVQHHQNATSVKFNLYLKGFDFDEQRSVFTVYAWTVLTWKDFHIKWDPKSYGNLSRIHLTASEIWLPDLSVFNNLDKSEIDHFGNTRVLAYSSSLMVWVPPTKFQVGCTSDLRKWPMDVQNCFVVVGSWAHDGSQIYLTIPTNQTTMDTSDMLKNREWNLVQNTVEQRVNYFECCPGVPFPDVVMTFTLAREGSTHKAAVVVPGLAIAMGVLIAFWIQPGATERLILLLACIINNTMYLSYIYRSLPNNGDSVPLVLLFYRDSLMMISVALVWTICLRYLAASKRTSPVPLPGFIQTFLTSVPAKILCLDPRPINNPTSDSRGNGDATTEGGADTGKLVNSGNPYQEDWAWLAHLLDRVAFLIYLVVYLTFYLALL